MSEEMALGTDAIAKVIELIKRWDEARSDLINTVASARWSASAKKDP